METLTREQFAQRYGEDKLQEFNNPVARDGSDYANDFGIGMAKGFGDTVYGTANLITEGGRYLQAGLDPTKTVKDYQAQAEQSGNTEAWWVNPFAGRNQAMIEEGLKADNSTQVAGKVGAFAVELFTPMAYAKGATLLNKAGKGSKTIEAGKELAGSVVEKVTDNKVIGGVTQTAQEQFERIPRFVGKLSEDISEASVRRELIKESDEVTKQALKSGLDTRYINSIEEADEATRKAYLEILDMADSPNPTLRPKARPEIVAGKTAGEQYKLIDSKRREIGEQIGQAVDKLSTKGAVSVADDQAIARQVLRDNGITVVDGQLNFVGKFTNAERNKLQELYNLATEGGDTLTPRQIRDMDNLFSKLQRESRMEQVGDIFVTVTDATGKKTDMPIFQVFRDIYSNKLDDIAPELKDLNRQYRNYRSLQDDIDKSIFKTGNFQNSKHVDPSEFAQTNLRRIFSDAQSATDYRQIYEELDRVSRLDVDGLRYSGARADDLANFAYNLRDLYPETVPRTSAEGIWGRAWQVISEGGKPDVVDQRRALRVFLEDRVQ